MQVEPLVFGAPVLGIMTFLSLEKAMLRRPTRWSKVIPTGVIHCVNFALSLALSLALLVPLVFAIVPFQIFSLSEWPVPVWISFSVSFLFLDFIHYCLHRLHHAIPALWRIHRLHHSDRDVDVFTTALHHPLELLTAFLGVVVCAVLLDVPVIVLTSYSVAIGFHGAFTHLNLQLPVAADRLLKWMMVTPNFHRTHHSLDMRDGNSNYGAIFVFWDYLLGTVSRESGDEVPMFGISTDQTPPQDSIGAYLKNPLRQSNQGEKK